MNLSGRMKMSTVRRVFTDSTNSAEDNYADPSDKFWPRFFLLGAARSGSGALHDFLTQHPRVCGAQPRGSGEVVKEINFFGDKKNYEEGGRFFYLSFFQNSSKCNELDRNRVEHFFLDGTVTNLAGSGVARRMKHAIPNRLHSKLRFVVVLREPVERDRSWTAEVRRRHGLPMSDAVYAQILRVRSRDCNGTVCCASGSVTAAGSVTACFWGRASANDGA